MSAPLPFTSVRELAGRIDHALLSADATPDDVDLVAGACRDLGVRALVVAPGNVARATRALEGSSVRVAAVVGFPLGNTTTAVKQMEALECERLGAVELDVVINVGLLKAGDARAVEREMGDVMRRTPECAHKIIIETGHLDASQVRAAVKIVNALGPRFIKTCTGFGPRGVTVADVELIKTDLASGILIKASAGVRDLSSALALLGAGASVLGTSSTAAILGELERMLGASP